MKEIYKNVGAVIITVELLIAMYCYIFIPFIPINTMEYGVLLNIIKQKTVDSITVDKNSEYVTVTLKDISDTTLLEYPIQSTNSRSILFKRACGRK